MEVYGFGLGVGVACLAGGMIGRAQARRRGITRDDWWRLVTGLMIWGMIGGRLAHVVPHAAYYLANPLEIIRPPIEGYSYYGAILFGALYCGRFARRVHKSFWVVADLLVQPWLFALLITGLIWGVPVVKVGAPSWLVLIVDIVYLSALYVLLGWAGQSQRRIGGFGRMAMTVLAVDALLRLSAGVLFASTLPAAVADQTVNHVVRGVALAIGIAGAAMLGGGVRPAWERSSLSFSRWVGWILGYALLITIKVAIHS